MEEMYTFLQFMTDENDPDPRVDRLHQELATIKEKLKKLVSTLFHSDWQCTLNSHFYRREIEQNFKRLWTKASKSMMGPSFVHWMFDVHRQAYYSGTFISNHVHRTLKVTKLILMNTFTNENLQPENLNWLCTSITLLANGYDPRIRSRAAEISRKFRVAFELFAACHNIYDKLQVTDAEIHTLGKFFLSAI